MGVDADAPAGSATADAYFNEMHFSLVNYAYPNLETHAFCVLESPIQRWTLKPKTSTKACTCGARALGTSDAQLEVTANSLPSLSCTSCVECYPNINWFVAQG